MVSYIEEDIDVFIDKLNKAKIVENIYFANPNPAEKREEWNILKQYQFGGILTTDGDNINLRIIQGEPLKIRFIYLNNHDFRYSSGDISYHSFQFDNLCKEIKEVICEILLS